MVDYFTDIKIRQEVQQQLTSCDFKIRLIHKWDEWWQKGFHFFNKKVSLCNNAFNENNKLSQSVAETCALISTGTS